ncbi:sigma-54 dependent transcriptional regulator [Myxococcota bacterium]|nr:sigma-54 dependent transcriptional regulator [Myxococcota bacterium]
MPGTTRHPRGLVLVIDDDPSLAALVERWLSAEGWGVEVRAEGESGLEGLSSLVPDAVILDLGLPGGLDGLTVLERIHRLHPLLPVVILNAESDVGTVVAAVKGGAWDYLTKPIDRTKLVMTMRNAIEHGRMSMRLAELERVVEGSGFPGIIGRSPAILALFRQLERVAKSDVTTLIHGESGTGKELVARAIHDSGGRAKGPFVAVNCAAVPETLQESELFGHEKGAFTGATTRRIGRFEQANGGTLFLDEIGELSAGAQAKLLRVLQERRFHRVGADEEITSDFRLVAATHRDLAKEVKEGRFREDLYFRVAVYELEMPPLRARAQDVVLLAETFVTEHAAREGRPLELTEDVREALLTYDWPGNVRELKNAIERAVVACAGARIELEHLPKRIAAVLEPDDDRASAASSASSASGASSTNGASATNGASPANGASAANGEHGADTPPRTLEALERLAIEQALVRHKGNLKGVVEELGIGRTTLYRKLKQYRLG